MAPRKDPYKNFKFRVEIDNMMIAGFSECTGIESEVTCIEYREGGDSFTRKLPGLHKVGDITLKRGVTKSKELWDWHKNILNGVPDGETARSFCSMMTERMWCVGYSPTASRENTKART